MRGQLTFESRNPALAATRYIDAITALLREPEPAELERQGESVFVRPAALIGSWHLLSAVTAATIRATPSERDVTVLDRIPPFHGGLGLWNRPMN